MIFEIQTEKNTFYKKIYEKSISELESFFGIRLKAPAPSVYLAADRMTIDRLAGRKTSGWMIGWIDGRNIYILSAKSFEKHSTHKYSPDSYFRLMKHELAHIYYREISGGVNGPDWLWEGTAMHAAGQVEPAKGSPGFKDFLRYYKKTGPGVYNEAGAAVEFLVKKYGKKRLLRLIRSLKKADTKEKFTREFMKIYGFKLNYKNFNL